MTDEQEQRAGGQRVGWVDLSKVHLPETAPLENSADYQDMQRRLASSAQVLRNNEARSDLRLEEQLTAILDELVAGAGGGIEGIMIGSDDGLLVAQSRSMQHGEVLAAISSLFEITTTRARREGLVARVDEMTLRGLDGEQIVVRYFTGLHGRFFLIAYARKQHAYRRVTTQAMKRCGALLHRVVDEPATKAEE